MNIVVFCFRAFIAFGFGTGSVVNFATGKTNSGLAGLAFTIVILQPLVRVLYFRQKLLPASSLAKGFTNRRGLAWSRYFCGFILAAASLANIDTNTDVEVNSLLLLFGLFLLSPLNNRVFTYSRRPSNPAAIPKWKERMAFLVFIRSLGLILILFALGAWLNHQYTLGHTLAVIGILLVFIRQLRHLFKPGQTQDTPAPSFQSAFPHNDTQPAPASFPTSPATDLKQLSQAYTALLQLGPGQKGPAYRDFLNNLFPLYDFPDRGNFRLDNSEINGIFELENQTYILVAKWQEQKSGHNDLLIFNGKVEAKSAWARGIFISDAGFTNDGLETFSLGKRTSIIGMDGQDIRLVLEGRLSLVDAIKRKARRAVETNRSFVPLHELI